MKEKTIVSLFNYYVGFWVIELKLNDKYKFEVKKDNRISAYAQVEVVGPYLYSLKYNSKKYKHRWQIIHVVLHELGHILHDFREGNEGEHEYVAELFALEKAKLYYPKYYNKMVNWTKRALLKPKGEIDEAHFYGYQRALEKLNEL